MARVLFDGLVEYEDGESSFSMTFVAVYRLYYNSRVIILLGTPATTSQMAKDVTTFLSWAAEPELDDRHLMGLQAMIIFSTFFAISIWMKRFKWAPIKNRKIIYDPPVPKK